MFVRHPGERSWVLIDAGVPGTAHSILSAAEKRFGRSSRPLAIVMTHDYFDHTGALKELSERWDAPVYAQDLELPFLSGTASYPPRDPAVGGGIMATLSRFYPRGRVDVGDRLRALPPMAVFRGCLDGVGFTRRDIPRGTSPSGARRTAR